MGLGSSLVLDVYSRGSAFDAVFPRDAGLFGVPPDAVSVWQPRGGIWRRVDGSSDASPSPSSGSATGPDVPPEGLLAAAADQDGASVIRDGPWAASPIGDGRVVLMAADAGSTDFDAVAGRVGQAMALVDSLRRGSSQSAILDSAAGWASIDDDGELLAAIADTACRVLACDRASVFLWDRPRHRLVGRPATGMPDGRLIVPDDAGLVAEVLRSGEARLWTAGEDSDRRRNAAVDDRTGYRTTSLAAHPMFDHRGRGVGVFEAINADAGWFDAVDADVLASLAAQAAAVIGSQARRKKLIAVRDRLIETAVSPTAMIGRHPSIEVLKGQIDRLAGTDLSVLVTGENGTGKEIVAERLHRSGPRRDEPFIAVNCAAMVETLVESELFGHVRGSFTGADDDRAGKFEAAEGGTIFLDEVGDLSPTAQAKLLRVLEQRTVTRVGSTDTIDVDVRVVAATNQPLEAMIGEGRFREDLFFRLNVASIRLPPLRARGDDVTLLADHFLRRFADEAGREELVFAPASERAMRSHPWPGNVRELRNAVQRAVYLAEGDAIMPADLALGSNPLSPPGPTDSPNLSDATRQFQRDHIERVIADCGGRMTEAAKLLGLHRSNLYRKMKQLEMDDAD